MLNLFSGLYWVAMVVKAAVRAPLRNTWKSNPKVEQRSAPRERLFLILLGLGEFILPFIFVMTPWLRAFDYRLPHWAGWLGAGLMVASLAVFAKTHADLNKFWSPVLEIIEDHKLITTGIYSRVRHPMYASQWLFVIAQALLLHNWVAGLAGLVIFAPFYFIRVRAEEQMMLDRFGPEYEAYRQSTGAIFPKI
ncbi:MAG: isoprenylcysteine carboxylmethyltransferase family protein [Anaerolineales bacterium]|nr:isoprenylcysteine carboxylmethyltransferase family protein [Anaerolineales bacterium]MCW5855030.1 isoprenylcysteine carboxylmethyltransferase family protein [Anaerolineales bacterium]